MTNHDGFFMTDGLFENGLRTVAGTTFGTDFLRLVRIGDYQLDAYLDGTLLLMWHRDVPGVIGAIGTAFGKHGVNISHMAVGRESKTPGGGAVAVLNLDSKPTADALEEIKGHPDITQVQIVSLPEAGAPLPWLGL